MQQLQKDELQNQENFQSPEAYIFKLIIHALCNYLTSLAIQYNFLRTLVDKINGELQEAAGNYLDEFAFLFESYNFDYDQDKSGQHHHPGKEVITVVCNHSDDLELLNKHKQMLEPELFFFLRGLFLLTFDPDEKSIIKARLDINMANEIAPENPYIKVLKVFTVDEKYSEQLLIQLVNDYTAHPNPYPAEIETPLQLIIALKNIYFNNIIDIKAAVQHLMTIIPKNEIALSFILYKILHKYDTNNLLEITEICLVHNDREEALKAIQAVILIQGFRPLEGIRIMDEVSVYDLPVSLEYQLFFLRNFIYALMLTNQHDKAYTLCLDIMNDEDMEGLICEHYFEIGLMLAQLHVARKYYNHCIRYFCCNNNLMYDYHQDNNPHQLYKILGDAWKGLYNFDLAVKYYKKALGVKYDDEIYRQMMRISNGV